MRSLMWHVVGSPRPMAPIDVELVRGGTAIVQPAATPWRTAQEQITPGAKIWLVTAP